MTLTGRLKETHRVGGEQVMPTEIEEVLTRHPEAAQAHVVPVPVPVPVPMTAWARPAARGWCDRLGLG